MKLFKQIRAPPGHVKGRAYPKQVTQEGDVQRYGGIKMIRKDETIFAAYDKAEMRKAKTMIIANSVSVHTSKSRSRSGSGRPAPNAVGVNGYRGSTTDGNEPDHDRICRHKVPSTQ